MGLVENLLFACTLSKEIIRGEGTKISREIVQDDPKLLDDGGEMPKCQGRGWRFDSRL